MEVAKQQRRWQAGRARRERGKRGAKPEFPRLHGAQQLPFLRIGHVLGARVLPIPKLPVRVLAQVSLHTCPRALFRELRHVFPGVDLDACLAVPTSQKADMDLVAFGDTVENEKDRLLNSVRQTRKTLVPEELQQ